MVVSLCPSVLAPQQQPPHPPQSAPTPQQQAHALTIGAARILASGPRKLYKLFRPEDDEACHVSPSPLSSPRDCRLLVAGRRRHVHVQRAAFGEYSEKEPRRRVRLAGDAPIRRISVDSFADAGRDEAVRDRGHGRRTFCRERRAAQVRGTPPPTFEPRDLSVLLLIRSENKLLMLRAAILAIAAHSRCDVTAAGVRILGSADVAQINLWKMLAKRMHYYHVFHRCTIPLGISA